MICPNCHANINEEDVFCKMCGTRIVSQNTNQQTPNMTSNNYQNDQQLFYNQVNVKENQQINDDELIDAYIGKKADKIRQGGFSVATFNFGILGAGWVYALYRKMWLFGFCWLGLNSLISLIPIKGIGILNFIIMVLVSIKFKELYLAYVKKEVQVIKKNNPGKTKEQLLDICKHRGGVYPSIAILVFAIYLLIFTVLVINPWLASQA